MGEPALLRRGVNNNEDRYSEHGLGHLLNPADPESEDRSWIAQAWPAIVRWSLGLPTKRLGFERARGRRARQREQPAGSPSALGSSERRQGAERSNKLKPFNFIISCHVAKLGHPIGADPERFHLIAPFEADPRQWEKLRWIDQHSAGGTASAASGAARIAHHRAREELRRRAARVRVPSRSQSAPTSAAPHARKQTVGLLGRRHVAIDAFTYIGKESNKLEEIRRAKPHRSKRRLHRVSRAAARRVGDEDSAEAQSHAATRAMGGPG